MWWQSMKTAHGEQATHTEVILPVNVHASDQNKTPIGLMFETILL